MGTLSTNCIETFSQCPPGECYSMRLSQNIALRSAQSTLYLCVLFANQSIHNWMDSGVSLSIIDGTLLQSHIIDPKSLVHSLWPRQRLYGASYSSPQCLCIGFWNSPQLLDPLSWMDIRGAAGCMYLVVTWLAYFQQCSNITVNQSVIGTKTIPTTMSYYTVIISNCLIIIANSCEHVPSLSSLHTRNIHFRWK